MAVGSFFRLSTRSLLCIYPPVGLVYLLKFLNLKMGQGFRIRVPLASSFWASGTLALEMDFQKLLKRICQDCSGLSANQNHSLGLFI